LSEWECFPSEELNEEKLDLDQRLHALVDIMLANTDDRQKYDWKLLRRFVKENKEVLMKISAYKKCQNGLILNKA